MNVTWTVAYQAPSSMGFSRQEYWSGLPLPSPENVSNLILSLIYSSATYAGRSELADSENAILIPPLLT